MSEEHGNSTLKVYGTEVTKLFGSRYLIEVRCEIVGKDDWYYENVSNGEFFKEFGDLYSSPLNINGESSAWEPDTGEEYPNMRLVSTRLSYIPQKANPVVTLKYETLTSTFVQESDEQVDQELNGLRRVTRTLIAKEGTAYSKVVADDTISHTSEGYDAATLYLGTVREYDKKPEEGGFTRIVETWVEAGKLSESVGQPDRDGKIDTTYEYLIQDPTLPPISLSGVLSKRISNFEGIRTYVVSTTNISALINGYSYKATVPFTIPGTVDTETNGVTGIGNFTNLQLVVSPPVSTNADATFEVTYSTTGTATSAVYRPASWTRTKIYGAGLNARAFAFTTTHSNHIRLSGGSSISTGETAGGAVGFVQGNRVYGGTTAEVEIIGPTYDPAGKTIILSHTHEPSFTLLDGTQYFRSVKITADIPARDT